MESQRLSMAPSDGFGGQRLVARGLPSRDANGRALRSSIMLDDDPSRRRRSMIQRRICIHSPRHGARERADKLLVASGEPPHAKGNGWQAQCPDVMSRMAEFLNCNTMSDVIFCLGQRQIPAHSFLLAVSSPIFYARVVGRAAGCSGALASAVRTQGPLQIFLEYDFECFFEFLRYLYTDEAVLTLHNIIGMMALAEDFKAGGLAERCITFLRASVLPETALKILRLSELLTCKSVVSCWREGCQDAMRKKRSNKPLVSKVDRLRERPTQGDTASRSSRSGEPSSGEQEISDAEFSDSLAALSTYSPRQSRSMSRSSVWETGTVGARSSSTSGPRSRSQSLVAVDCTNVLASAGLDGIIKSVSVDPSSAGAIYRQVIIASQDCHEACWKLVINETRLVITGPDLVDQDERRIKAILNLNTCSVAEVEIFRALLDWADCSCRRQGYTVSPVNRRKVLASLVDLVRFPLMTLNELQWDVVTSGVLDYEDVTSLQDHVVNGGRTRFITEPRELPMGAYLSKRRGSEPTLAQVRDERQRADRTAEAFYAPAEGDEVDALMGMRLWRKHVNKITKQTDFEVAQAKLDPPAAARGAAAATPRRLKPMSAIVDPGADAAELGAEPITPAPLFFKSRGSTMLMTSARIAVEAKQGPSSARTPRRKGPGDQGWANRTTKGAGVMSPMTSSREGAGTPGPGDFQRLGEGMYRFRDYKTMEVRVEFGQPIIYERPAVEVSEAGLALLPPPRPTSRSGFRGGVPLEAFLARRTQETPTPQ